MLQEDPNKISPKILIRAEQNEYSMVPGSSTGILLHLVNQGENQDYFEIGIRGIPASWTTLSDQVVQLAPGEEREITLTIQLPPPPQTQAGVHPVIVVAVSQADPRQIAQVEIPLHVAVFESRGRIGVMLESVQFSTTTGSSSNVKILLVNQGLQPDSFRLSVGGLPVNWLSTQTPTMRLEPGEKKEITLTIHPPQTSGSKAGRHSFKIKINSELVPEDFVEVSCIPTIAAYSEYRASVQPEQGEAGVPAQLKVENNGNVNQTFHLSWQSPENALLFEAILPAPPADNTQPAAQPEPKVVPLSEPFPLNVPAGEVGSVNFQARPAKRVLIGGEANYPYTVQVLPTDKAGTGGQVIQAQVSARGLVPVWVVPAVLVIFLGFACLFSFLVIQQNNQNASATQIAASGTAVVGGATQTSAANATAAAAEGQSDSDKDGLTNSEEIKLGTDPAKADTDGDGLEDGQEVNKTKTNPLNPDTDGDGLEDGHEVNELKTDPLSQDTDGDGLQDGNEVKIGTDPRKPDTDNDGLKDGQETPPCPNPLDPDTDKDGIIDGKDLNPCDAKNPSLTATAETGKPPAETPPTETPPSEATATGVPPTNAPAKFSGVIAFGSDRDGNPEIYAEKAADHSVTRLTNNDAADTQPSWSPDGSRLAFTTNRDGNNEIYLMNADGGNPVNLSNNPGDDQFPAWSPDGKTIAFQSNRDGNYEIYTIRDDGTEAKNLTNNPAEDNHPTWFKKQLAFATNRDGNFEVYAMNIDGSSPLNLTNNPASDNFPLASHDGKSIAFVSDRDGNQEIYQMGSGGAAPTNLSKDPAYDTQPSWSPDDKWIAFSSNRGNPDIYIVRFDGSTTENFTNHPAADDYPTWH